MQKRESIDYTNLRKEVSKLFFLVLSGRMIVREALLRFPRDCADTTLEACWHALCHLESDEDLRKRDKEYAQEQDEYIEFIAHTLANGEALPQNIINEYYPYHNEMLISENKTVKGIFHKLKKFLCC